jgi:hypothetical protein
MLNKNINLLDWLIFKKLNLSDILISLIWFSLFLPENFLTISVIIFFILPARSI